VAILGDDALNSTRNFDACRNGVGTKDRDFWIEISLIPRENPLSVCSPNDPKNP
jgi:hypothetical protein